MSTETDSGSGYKIDEPEGHLTKPIDELSDEDLELLWIIKEHPEATPAQIAEVYGYVDKEPVENDLQELLDTAISAADVIASVLFDDGYVEYEPDSIDREISRELSEVVEENVDEQDAQDSVDEPEGVQEDGEEPDEVYACEHCGDEFDTERARSIHVTRAHEMTYTDAQIETLQTILKHPGKDQRSLSEVLDISKSGVEYRVEAIRDEYGEFDWSNRILVAEEILKEEGVEIPDVVDEDGQSFECQNCGREFESRSSLGSHERFCDGSLTDRQREALEVVRDNPEKNQEEVADMLDISNSSLSSVFNDQLEYPWGQRLEAVDEYLDQDDQDESDDDVELRAFDRDVKNVDEAVEDILDEEDEETPHVKNEEPETFATEMRPAEAFEIIRDLDDAMLARGIYREVLDAARKGEI